MKERKTMNIVFVITLVVVLFSIIGGTASDLKASGDAVTDANNCSKGSDVAGPLVYNITDKYCYNSTSDPVYLAEQYDLPLTAFFASNGFVILLLMTVFLLIFVNTAGKELFNK